jgi:sRNA-binding regulator protein Hfq
MNNLEETSRLKRSRYEEIEEYETEEEPNKKFKPSHEHNFMFKCNLLCTKKFDTPVRFVLVNGVKLDSNVLEFFRQFYIFVLIFRNSNHLKFKVSDFVNKRALLSYTNENPSEFEVRGLDVNSACLMSYLKGVLARKNEVAILPIPDSDFQILLFDKEENELFEPVLSAIVVRKYNLILDLDETLIKTKLVLNSSGKLNNNEFFFQVENCHYNCHVRPGTEQLCLNLKLKANSEVGMSNIQRSCGHECHL